MYARMLRRSQLLIVARSQPPPRHPSITEAYGTHSPRRIAVLTSLSTRSVLAQQATHSLLLQMDGIHILVIFSQNYKISANFIQNSFFFTLTVETILMNKDFIFRYIKKLQEKTPKKSIWHEWRKQKKEDLTILLGLFFVVPPGIEFHF